VKLFTCPACTQVLFFENVRCGRCARRLAYLPDHRLLSALDPVPDGAPQTFVALSPAAHGARYRLCDNYTRHGVCNWAIPESDSTVLCAACRLNEMIPNLSEAGNLATWQRLEAAKRRLLYTLIELRLPVAPKREDPAGLAFAFKKNLPGDHAPTGHMDGLVTINISEAEGSTREYAREQLGEAYRTLLGHFRHECGHYYWARLVERSRWLAPFRALFGDERADYAQAASRHYAAGPPAGWTENFVSAYASMHPWEDWAESFAHYLHIVDTLETARYHGLSLVPWLARDSAFGGAEARELRAADFDALMDAWFPLTIALNNFNRGMGMNDLYPFVLAERAVLKLHFVHEVVGA